MSWPSIIRVSCIRCWWTCGPGWLGRSGRIGSSRCRWRRRARVRRLQGPLRYRPGLRDHHRYHGHPGNAGDGGAAADLITDLIPETHPEQPGTEQPGTEESSKVFGDCAYGSGEFQSTLEEHGIDSGCKTQPPAPRPGGLFTKDRFDIDLDRDAVTCPNGVTTPIRRGDDGAGTASFGAACADCPFRAQCTTSKTGRTVTVSAYEAELARARARQTDPAWQADYTATRPRVERKIGHLMRRKHGGRRARMRGLAKVAADFSLLAAAVNLARLDKLGLASTTAGTPTVTTA